MSFWVYIDKTQRRTCWGDICKAYLEHLLQIWKKKKDLYDAHLWRRLDCAVVLASILKLCNVTILKCRERPGSLHNSSIHHGLWIKKVIIILRFRAVFVTPLPLIHCLSLSLPRCSVQSYFLHWRSLVTRQGKSVRECCVSTNEIFHTLKHIWFQC